MRPKLITNAATDPEDPNPAKPPNEGWRVVTLTAGWLRESDVSCGFRLRQRFSQVRSARANTGPWAVCPVLHLAIAQVDTRE